MYINLVIVEEAKSIVGWESIREQIRLEDHKRSEPQQESGENQTILDNLPEREYITMKVSSFSINNNSFGNCNTVIMLIVLGLIS